MLFSSQIEVKTTILVVFQNYYYDIYKKRLERKVILTNNNVFPCVNGFGLTLDVRRFTVTNPLLPLFVKDRRV